MLSKHFYRLEKLTGQGTIDGTICPALNKRGSKASQINAILKKHASK